MWVCPPSPARAGGRERKREREEGTEKVAAADDGGWEERRDAVCVLMVGCRAAHC